MYDIAIIGGGVNGCGIARDAAGRGLSVLLAEMNDLASGTSSSSTKLIHGGLRYLEHYDFRLVRESLVEREVLYGMAPHIIHPLRFVLPHNRAMRPPWLIRLGLFLYDHIGGRKILPRSHGVNLKKDEAGSVLKSSFTKGFEYSDCRVDDARLVVINAIDAAKRGADIRVRTTVTSAVREGDHWRVTLKDNITRQEETVEARTLINAAGPWVADIISKQIGIKTTSGVRCVKGSHIVVPRLFDHDRAYIFQNPDNRIIFAIPYEQNFTLIGTTDVDYDGDPADVSISPDEISYLCKAASEYFNDSVHPDDVTWSYSGVRPLYNEEGVSAQEVTRDYVLERDGKPNEPALLSIFGGKITTYRRLAEDALEIISDCLKPEHQHTWTRGSALPGGDFPLDGLDKLVETLRKTCPALSASLAHRLITTYGKIAFDICAPEGIPMDLGEEFGAGLTQAEVEYLIRHEWAHTSEDILWRRTKLGLLFTPEQTSHLDDWLNNAVKNAQHVA